MESEVSEQLHEAKIINMEEYLYRKAILGILNRTELSEEIKKYPPNRPVMRVSVNNMKGHASSEDDRKKIAFTEALLENIKSF